MHRTKSGTPKTHSNARQRRRERKAAQQRLKRIRWLRRKGTGEPNATVLADKLDRCTPRTPCGSAACPECSLSTSSQLTKAFRKFLRTRAAGDTVVAITVVLASSVVAPGMLHVFDPVNSARRLKYIFDQAGVGWVIGALDQTLNTHEDARYADHWLVHLHAFAVVKDPNHLRVALAEVLPKSDMVPRPLRVQEWDGKKKAIRYALKTVVRRRIGTDTELRFSKATNRQRQCRATKTQRLRSAEKLELVLFLDRIGWKGRLFLRHAQQRPSQAGTTTITLMRNHGGKAP